MTLAGVEALLEVIAESAAAARARRAPPRVPDGLVELLADLDLDALDDAAFAELAAAVGVDLGRRGASRRWRVVNAVLDALPAATREAILIRFLSVIYS